MVVDLECVFCRILSGKIPAKIIAQNDEALAVLDAFPLAVGHALVISKRHSAKVQQLEKNAVHRVFEMACKVAGAVEGATGAPATTIAVHNGREAGQEIPHVHVHIIPRRAGDGAGPVHSMFRNRPSSGSTDMDSVCSEISSRVPQD
ncbi:MAG TPA: HIT domain-containing protein [Nitrososphaera sp.]|nr:HIT domain-containing protein [Nitrososphaera sp.]